MGRQLLVERELPSGKRASQWEGSFLVEESFPVGRQLPSGKRASQWEVRFPVNMELGSEKRASQ